MGKQNKQSGEGIPILLLEKCVDGLSPLIVGEGYF